MRIEITRGGIYGSNGKQIPVGTELTVKDEPKGWAGRYRVVSGAGKGKTAITNPAGGGDTALKAEHHGGGKFNVTEGETVHLKGLSKADADAFNEMSDEDKRAFVEASKQG